MSTTASPTGEGTVPIAPLVTAQPEKIRSWKVPIALTIFTALFAILLLAAPREGVTTFRLSTPTDAIQLPELAEPVMATAWVCVVLLALLTVASVFFVRAFARSPLWIVIVYILAIVVGFLT